MPAFLLPLLLNLAPTVASWVLGDKTGNAVEKITGIVGNVLGTDMNGDAIERALAADPATALAFKTALIKAEAEARADEHAEVMAQLADVRSAREQTVGLAQAKSPLAWGAAIVSVLVLGTFGVMLYKVIGAPAGAVLGESAQNLLGMLGTMATGVVYYWVGSTAGSAAKTALVGSLAAGRR